MNVLQKSRAALLIAFSITGTTLLEPSHARPRVGQRVSGIASWAQRTSRPYTAARLPRGSKLWVWRPGQPSRTGLAVWVNDSGPYVKGRVLDLSTGAFKHLFGSLKRGHGPVRYKILKLGKKRR